MTKRKGRVATARALRRQVVLREIRSTFRNTVDGMRREYAAEKEAAARRIIELSMERVGLRATIERQREILEHPFRHLVRWVVSSPATRHKERGE